MIAGFGNLAITTPVGGYGLPTAIRAGFGVNCQDGSWSRARPVR
jgi:hypothetical protein